MAHAMHGNSPPRHANQGRDSKSQDSQLAMLASHLYTLACLQNFEPSPSLSPFSPTTSEFTLPPHNLPLRCQIKVVDAPVSFAMSHRNRRCPYFFNSIMNHLDFTHPRTCSLSNSPPPSTRCFRALSNVANTSIGLLVSCSIFLCPHLL